MYWHYWHNWGEKAAFWSLVDHFPLHVSNKSILSFIMKMIDLLIPDFIRTISSDEVPTLTKPHHHLADINNIFFHIKHSLISPPLFWSLCTSHITVIHPLTLCSASLGVEPIFKLELSSLIKPRGPESYRRVIAPHALSVLPVLGPHPGCG